MAKKSKARKISIECLEKYATGICYRMDPPNTWILPEHDGAIFQSSPFKFKKARWRFRYYSLIESENYIKRSSHLAIIKLDSEELEQNISFTVIVLDADGQYFNEFCGIRRFQKTHVEYKIADFRNYKLCSNIIDNPKGDTLILMIHFFWEVSTEVIKIDKNYNLQKVEVSSREMAKATENGNISLELSKKPSICYTFKAPNFFKHPEYSSSFSLNSPSFEFANGTWCIRFMRSQENILGSEEFSVTMARLKSEIQKQTIVYTIILLNDVEENELIEDSGVHAFGEDSDDLLMKIFDKFDSSFDECETLTLMINLICIDSTQEATRQLQVTTDKKITSLSNDFRNVWLNGKDYNLTFSVKDKTFQAHQDILRARSEVFQSMLTHDMLEKKTGVIDVPDCDPEAFEQFLCYVYTGKVETLDENNMLGLYYVTDKYNTEQLKEEICDFIKHSINLTNVCDVLELASKHSDVKLLDCASSYFYDNVDDILPTLNWQLFMKNNSTVANELFIKSLKKIRDAKL